MFGVFISLKIVDEWSLFKGRLLYQTLIICITYIGYYMSGKSSKDAKEAFFQIALYLHRFDLPITFFSVLHFLTQPRRRCSKNTSPGLEGLVSDALDTLLRLIIQIRPKTRLNALHIIAVQKYVRRKCYFFSKFNINKF